MEQLKPTSRPGDGAWRADQRRRRSTPRRCARRRRPISRRTRSTSSASRRSPSSARSSTRSCKRRRLHPGHGRRAAGRAQRRTRRSSTPNTDAGRAELLAGLNDGVKAMYAQLPRAFATLPNAPLEIRRVPPEIQDGASNGYYRRAALDGSRPAIYFINLKDTGDWPKYSLPSLTYHEGVPGHHLQISITQESKDIPTLAQDRRLLGLLARAGRSIPSSSPTSSAAISGTRTRRLSAVLPVPRRAAGDRHRPPRQALEPRAGDRLHGRHHRLRPAALAARGRALLHPDRPGLQLQDRPHRLDPRPRRSAGSARRRGSTSSSSTKCCAKARCRCRSSSAGS